MFRPGYLASRLRAAACATPGLAPSRYSRLPSRAISAMRPAAKSMPGQRPFKGLPKILAAYTTPMPSGSTRSAPLRASRNAGSARAVFTSSGLGVTT